VSSDRIKMKPAVFFPRKNQAVSRGPHQLALRAQVLKNAADTFVCSPNHLAFAGSDIGDDDRPRQSRALGSEQQGPTSRAPNKRIATRGRGPLRVKVAINRSCDPSQVLTGNLVHADE